MKYDVIIIGGGPAGITASIYATRYKLKIILISRTRGGLAATAHKICNYPSYSEIKGFELMQKFISQAESLNIPIVYSEVKKISGKNKNFVVETEKEKFEGKKIILASGTERQRLNIEGEGKFSGRGVSYCTSCDAAFFKDRITAVIGGSDAALTSALLLSEYCKNVYIIYKGEEFRAEPSWIELIRKNRKIKSIFGEEAVQIIGNERVESVRLKSGRSIKVDGVFVEIGSVPKTELLIPLNVKLSKKGYVLTDRDQKTNIRGLYSAGDVTDSSLKQIITAAGQGAVAAYNLYREIKKDD